MCNKEALIEQTKLLHEIVAKADINVVTCGNCGTVILHRIECSELKCFDCGYEADMSDFPDLFFEHYYIEHEPIVTLEIMYGDGDEYHTMEINPKDYHTTYDILKSVDKKITGYEVGTILGQKNSDEADRLTDEELIVFKKIYSDVPDKGGFKQHDYIHFNC